MQYLRDLRDRGAKVTTFPFTAKRGIQISYLFNNSIFQSLFNLYQFAAKVIIGDFYEEAARHIMCQVKHPFQLFVCLSVSKNIGSCFVLVWLSVELDQICPTNHTSFILWFVQHISVIPGLQLGDDSGKGICLVSSGLVQRPLV